MKSTFIMFPRGQLPRSLYAGNAGITLLFLFLLIACRLPGAYAQQHEYLLFQGVVFDADTRQPMPGAHYRINGVSGGATDSSGMFSLYASYHDTITFTSVGYKQYSMTVEDTLRAKEYVTGVYLSSDTLVIPGIVVIPRLGNIRAEIMSERPAVNQEMINATNNLRLSTYQGLTMKDDLGDPALNYELLRQKQRYEAYEKGQIGSGQMVAISPLLLIPVIYTLAAGPPKKPEPPVPYISARDMEHIRAAHDSLIYRKPRR